MTQTLTTVNSFLRGKPVQKIAIIGGVNALWPSLEEAHAYDELWGMNDIGRKCRRFRWSKYFDLHDYGSGRYVMSSKQFEWHWGAARNIPVLCHPSSTMYFPVSSPFPFREVQTHFGKPEETFFTSTLAWLFAYVALRPDIQTVGLYGIAQAHADEYIAHKPCSMYWLGRLRGQGVNVVLPEGCPLFEVENIYAM
jgi:hypothetical protein